MENEEPSTLRSHRHEPPGKTVKQIIHGEHGHTEGCEAIKRKRERGEKNTHTQLFSSFGGESRSFNRIWVCDLATQPLEPK